MEQTPTPHRGNWYVLVCRLNLDSDLYHLGEGISLRHLKSPLSVFDLAAAGAVGFRAWAVLEPIAHMCTCEIESPRDSAVVPGYDPLNRAWLVSALLTLRGFGLHFAPACSGYSWNVIAGHQERTSPAFHDQLKNEGIDGAVFQSKRDLPPFSGSLLDFHLEILAEKDTRQDKFNEDDARFLRKEFGVFNRLAAESEPFGFALRASVDWRFSKEPRSTVARLWSGIEALFGISSELVYRISLLSASILSPRGQTRKESFDRVKRLYNLRSKIVHGESLPDETIHSALGESFSLLRSILLYISGRGQMLGADDLDRLVFY